MVQRSKPDALGAIGFRKADWLGPIPRSGSIPFGPEAQERLLISPGRVQLAGRGQRVEVLRQHSAFGTLKPRFDSAPLDHSEVVQWQDAALWTQKRWFDPSPRSHSGVVYWQHGRFWPCRAGIVTSLPSFLDFSTRT